MNRALQQLHVQRINIQKQELLQQRAVVIWMTGLPASGKSTLARELELALLQNNYLTQWLDGDNMRLGLTSDLGFSDTEQDENIRRCAEAAKLFADSSIVTLCTFISPTIRIRDLAKTIIGSSRFLEVYVNCPLEVCIQRDQKRMYSRALRGGVVNLSGVDFPYEAPKQPWLELHTNHYSVEDCVNKLLDKLTLYIKPL